MDDARYRIVGIKERAAGHALGQFLGHLDKLDAALYSEGAAWTKPGLMLSGSPGDQAE